MNKIKQVFRKATALISGFMISTSALLPVSAFYPDVAETDPAYEAISYCEEKGIMTGYEDGNFHGADELSRGMLATILWRLFGAQDSYGNGYADVPDWSFYKEASSWVQEQGLMTGNEHEDGINTFDGEDPIRRQDLSLIFYRLHTNTFSQNAEYDPLILETVQDPDSIEGYAVEGISWALDQELIDPVGNFLQPVNPSSRAVTAVMIQRYFEPREELLEEAMIQVPLAENQNWRNITSIIEPVRSSLRYESSGGYYYPSDELLIFFEKDASDEGINTAIDSLKGRVIGRNAILNLFQVQLPVKTKVSSLLSKAEEVMKFPAVKYATIDMGLGWSANYIPNDPWNGDVDETDWNDGNIDGSNWWAEAIHMPAAWEMAANLPVNKIGVIDTQVREDHEDLSGIVSFLDENARKENALLKNSESDSSVNRYHGTAVCALIGARHNNGTGLAGVIPNASIVFSPWMTAFQVENHTDAFLWDSTVYDTVARMITSGINVVNMSFSRSNGVVSFENDLTRAIMKRDNALASCTLDALLESGYSKFMIVQAAGNGNYKYQGISAGYAGFFNAISFGNPGISTRHSQNELSEHFMMVGAVDRPVGGLYPKVTYSGYADGNNFIYAPGRNLFSATAWESFDSNYSVTLQGTSFAAPIVSAVISLMWSANPNLSSARIQQILNQSASNNVNSMTAGSSNKMLDAQAAILAAMAG